jgi:hypothetical protein
MVKSAAHDGAVSARHAQSEKRTVGADEEEERAGMARIR